MHCYRGATGPWMSRVQAQICPDDSGQGEFRIEGNRTEFLRSEGGSGLEAMREGLPCFVPAAQLCSKMQLGTAVGRGLGCLASVFSLARAVLGVGRQELQGHQGPTPPTPHLLIPASWDERLPLAAGSGPMSIRSAAASGSASPGAWGEGRGPVTLPPVVSCPAALRHWHLRSLPGDLFPGPWQQL